MHSRRPSTPPPAVILIASLQLLKAAFLLLAAALLRFSPERLTESSAFSELLYVAAHGHRELSGFLLPVFGVYVAYVGVGLLRLQNGIRRNLALSSAITVAVSLQHLGLFGEKMLTSEIDRESLYILILLDCAVYLYLVFHPTITEAFRDC